MLKVEKCLFPAAGYGTRFLPVEEVPREETSRYGIVAGTEEGERIVRVDTMVEKPDPAQAPGNLAIIGRYLLTPDIFALIRSTPPGKNGEMQITDALMRQAQEGRVVAYKFKGQRFDCGSIDGFVAATQYVYQNLYQAKD